MPMAAAAAHSAAAARLPEQQVLLGATAAQSLESQSHHHPAAHGQKQQAHRKARSTAIAARQQHSTPRQTADDARQHLQPNAGSAAPLAADAGVRMQRRAAVNSRCDSADSTEKVLENDVAVASRCVVDAVAAAAGVAALREVTKATFRIPEGLTVLQLKAAESLHNAAGLSAQSALQT